MGRWQIRNHHYYGYESRTKYPQTVVDEIENPWVAVYQGASYYEAKKPGRFKTVEEAINYALSGGEPLDLTNTER